MADGEGNEAQCHVGDHRQGIDLLKGVESEAGDAQPSQHAGADQHAGDQVGRNVRQMEFHKQTGHQQPREQGNCNQQQGLHKGVQRPFPKIQGDRKALVAPAGAKSLLLHGIVALMMKNNKGFSLSKTYRL